MNLVLKRMAMLVSFGIVGTFSLLLPAKLLVVAPTVGFPVFLYVSSDVRENDRFFGMTED